MQTGMKPQLARVAVCLYGAVYHVKHERASKLQCANAICFADGPMRIECARRSSK